MIPPGTRLGVAVSGGADSVFLLHWLAGRGGEPLTVLHVNHRLRGEESDGDEVFVRELAEQLKMRVFVHHMGAVSRNLEQFCRQERTLFFKRVIESGLVDRVATGHTVSDQAETVLMRLLRGAGTTGLRGVLPVTVEGLIRPLLGVGREEVRGWLRERGLAWREDASNGSEAFLRNRVRARLLPVWRELAPEGEAALGRVAELAALDEDYWQEAAGAVLDRAGTWFQGGLVLDVRELAALHRALLGRVVRAGMARAFQNFQGAERVAGPMPGARGVAVGGAEGLGRVERMAGLLAGGSGASLRRVDREHVERVVELILGTSGEGAVSVPGGRVERSMDWVRLGGADGGTAEEQEMPGEGRVGERLVRVWEGEGYTGGDAVELDREQLRPPLRLRGWRAGDRLRAVGSTRERTVAEMLIRERVPSWERPFWPMITDSDGVVWTYRFGAAARAAAGPGTRIRLQVCCDRVSSK